LLLSQFNLAKLRGLPGYCAPEIAARCRSLPCSPNFSFRKDYSKGSAITIISIQLSYAARSARLLCALEGQDADRCRAHLISLLAKLYNKGSAITI